MISTQEPVDQKKDEPLYLSARLCAILSNNYDYIHEVNVVIS